jgi:hypothetical protein
VRRGGQPHEPGQTACRRAVQGSPHRTGTKARFACCCRRGILQAIDVATSCILPDATRACSSATGVLRHHIEFLSIYSALQTYRAFLPVLWGDPNSIPVLTLGCGLVRRAIAGVPRHHRAEGYLYGFLYRGVLGQRGVQKLPRRRRRRRRRRCRARRWPRPGRAAGAARRRRRCRAG